MAVEIVVPKLGWTAEEATLVEWKKQDGERVLPGEVYLLVEGDKAVNEVEAFEAGILRLLPDGPKVGDVVKVGALLGYFLQPGEPAPWEGAAVAVPAPMAADAPAPTASALAPHSTSASRHRVSPRARRVALELGIDPGALIGSGTSQRVVVADVMAAAASRPAAAAPATGPSRRTVAARMSTSAQQTAPVTLHCEIDASELFKLRETVNRDAPDAKLAYTDIFAKLCALALQEHPALNASWTDDGARQHAQVNIGIAVQGERGLLVPVLREPAKQSLHAIAAQSGRLIAAARAGTLSAADMQGGSFTLTNLGMYDVDAFTPIINLPECAILGIGRMVPKLVVLDEASEKTAIRKMLTLSLTFDHRVVDGAPAAAFLRRIKQFVEQPYVWLSRQ